MIFPAEATSTFHCFLGAHHLDLRAATAEDPDWLVDQRESEIKLIEGWIESYKDRKGFRDIWRLSYV